MITRFQLLWVLLASASLTIAQTSPSYTLQLLHASDLEGGVDAIDAAPNFAAIMDRLEDDYTNTIILSAGDNYIPGPFFSASNDISLQTVLRDVYNIYYGGTLASNFVQDNGRVDVSIMNIIGFDASALGNHEFDAGTDAINLIIGSQFNSSFTQVRWTGSQFPYLSSNLDFSADPNLSGLYVNTLQPSTFFRSNPSTITSTSKKSIAPYTVIERGGEMIGVIGATTPLLETISSPGLTSVLDPGAGTNDMNALASILQPRINELQAAGINKIILVSHLQQIFLEQTLAPLLSGIDLIVAGGSDAILANADDRLRPEDAGNVFSTYPLLTTNLDGEPVAIVSTNGEYSYVGRLIAGFDSAGVLLASSLSDLQNGPYVSDSTTVEELYGTYADGFLTAGKGELVRRLTNAVQAVVIIKDSNVMGKTAVYLDGRRSQVRSQETNLGDLTADANLALAKAYDPSTTVSIKNGGGIRAAIGEVVQIDDTTYSFLPPQANPLSGKAAGEISQLDIENSLRFNNGLSLLTVDAAGLKAIIEHGVSGYAAGATPGSFGQVGGVKFAFDPTQAIGSRVTQLAVLDEHGRVADAVVYNGQINGSANRKFRVVTLDFLAGGGDGYPFPALGTDRINLKTVLTDPGTAIFSVPGGEQDALAEYLQADFATTAYGIAETDASADERIQILGLRADSVYASEPCIPALVTRPRNLTVIEDASSVKLGWDAIPNTVGCQVFLGEEGGTPERRQILGSELSQFSVPKSKLTNGVNYIWSVRCACSLDPVGFGLYSRKATFSLGAEVLARQLTEGMELRVFPNPVLNQMTIQLDQPQGACWQITDATGVLRASGRISNQFTSISAEALGLSTGLYILDITTTAEHKQVEVLVIR